jgi:predicted nucleic acid-binding protein
MGAGALLCVTDTNIWIDLHRGGIIEKAFEMPFKLAAPDVIIAELQIPSGDSLISFGLQIKELSGPQVLMVLDLAENYVRPSREDLFALVLAKENDAILLSGDKSLRDAAREEGVKVHGTIWLLDQMVEYGIIDKRKRAASLKLMMKFGSRLPCEEVKARIRDV